MTNRKLFRFKLNFVLKEFNFNCITWVATCFNSVQIWIIFKHSLWLWHIEGKFFPHTFEKKYPFCGLISATRNRLIKEDDDALYKGLLKEYLTEKLDFQASQHRRRPVTFEHKKQFIFGARRKKSCSQNNSGSSIISRNTLASRNNLRFQIRSATYFSDKQMTDRMSDS